MIATVTGFPVITGGPPQSVTGTDQANLTAQVTDPEPVTFAGWAAASGPGYITSESGEGPDSAITVSAPGTYVFELQGTDSGGNYSSGEQTVTFGSYAAIGDSYSAGVGSGGTSLSGKPCYRNANAYPEIIDRYVARPLAVPAPGQPNPAFIFPACFGATTRELLPQLAGLPDESVSLVTLTIGGNDIEFAKIMKYCALRGLPGAFKSCESHNGKLFDADLAGLTKSLPALYKKIKNSPALAPGARIIVLGYPRFFPAAPPKRCPTGIPGAAFRAADMTWINQSISRLNALIAATAKPAGFTFVNTYNSFDGHNLCDPEPWLNKASVPVTSSFHPNRQGQAALAVAVEQALG